MLRPLAILQTLGWVEKRINSGDQKTCFASAEAVHLPRMGAVDSSGYLMITNPIILCRASVVIRMELSIITFNDTGPERVIIPEPYWKSNR
jgi:hypothetical protein